jgi:acyl carrier protein
MTSQTLDIVRRLAADTLNLPDRVVATATTLQEAGIDSLSAIDLVFAVEAHFGITIAPDDLESMDTLADLAGCVDRLTAYEARRYG